MLALMVVFSASVAGSHAGLVLKRLPPPAELLNGLLGAVQLGGCWAMVVLASCVLISLVGELMFPKAAPAVRWLRSFRLALI